MKIETKLISATIPFALLSFFTPTLMLAEETTDTNSSYTPSYTLV